MKSFLVKKETEEERLAKEKEKERLEKEEYETNLVVKNCPFCMKETHKTGGCDYMLCSNAEPKSTCSGEWCWNCHKPKYKIIPAKPELGCCNDKSHNSH